MTAHDPRFLRPIKQWLGLASGANDHTPEAGPPLALIQASDDPAPQQRREVVGRNAIVLATPADGRWSARKRKRGRRGNPFPLFP